MAFYWMTACLLPYLNVTLAKENCMYNDENENGSVSKV